MAGESDKKKKEHLEKEADTGKQQEKQDKTEKQQRENKSEKQKIKDKREKQQEKGERERNRNRSGREIPGWRFYEPELYGVHRGQSLQMAEVP